MSELLRFFKDMRDNGYGLAEIAAQLGTSAIAEPVAGFAAMYDPVHGADAIREGMTYQPRTQEAQQYSQSVGNAANAAIKPAMPIIDTWKKGVDIAGRYSPVVGAGLRTVPTAIGIAMGAKPALQTGRQVSKGLEKVQSRMVANATAPRTLNTGYMGQRGAVNVLNSVNPTGSVFVDYNPSHRANTPLAKNIVSYDKTSGGSPDELVTIYRGLPKNQKNINSGDFVTTNSRLAQDYAGDGHVIKMTVKKSELLDDINEPLGEEYIYRKQRPLTEFEQAHLLAQQRAALPVNQRGLDLPVDNTAMDRARAMGFDVDAFTGVNTTGEIDSMLPKSWFSEQSKYASDYSNVIPKSGIDAEPRVYPVILKTGNVKAKKYTGLYDDMESALSKKRTDTFKVENVGGGNNNFYVIKDPKNIRSRFAAFDPFNRESSNLLATTAPLVPTTALGAYMYNENRKKSQGKQ